MTAHSEVTTNSKVKDASKAAGAKSRITHRAQSEDSVLFLVTGFLLSFLTPCLEEGYLQAAVDATLADGTVREVIGEILLFTGYATMLSGFISSIGIVAYARSSLPGLAIFPLVIAAIEPLAKGSVISTLYGYSDYAPNLGTRPFLFMLATFSVIWMLIMLPAWLVDNLDRADFAKARLWRVSMRVYIAGSWVFSLYALVPWVCGLTPEEFSRSLLDGDVLYIVIVALSAVGFVAVCGSVVAMFVIGELVIKSHEKDNSADQPRDESPALPKAMTPPANTGDALER